MAIQFTPKKAVRRKKKMRIGLYGLAGSGKTHTAIKMARELVGPEGRILVIDTERQSAASFDFYDFDVIDDLDSYAPQVLTEALRYAAAEGYDAVVVDSMTTFWTGKDGALQQAERAKSSMNGGNNWNAWAKVTPAQDAMTDAILSAPFHVFICIRGKDKTTQGFDATGRKAIVSEGVQPIQKEGWEFEMDIFGRMTQEHEFIPQKTRVAGLDRNIFPFGDGVIDIVLDWLNTASDSPQAKPPSSYVDAESYIARAKEIAQGTPFFDNDTTTQRVMMKITENEFDTLHRAFTDCPQERADLWLGRLERIANNAREAEAARKAQQSPPAEPGPAPLTEKTRRAIMAHAGRAWGKGDDATKLRAAFMMENVGKQSTSDISQAEGEKLVALMVELPNAPEIEVKQEYPSTPEEAGGESGDAP